MLFYERYESELPSQRLIDLQRVLSSISCIALILVTTAYSFGVSRPSIPTISEVSGNHFKSLTPNAVMTFDVYVGLMYVGQILYLTRLMATKNEALLISATRGVSYHYVVFNILQIAQILAWTREKFFLMEIILVVNLFNLAKLNLRLGATSIRITVAKNINIHIPLVKMPLALTMMWLLQNTAILLDLSPKTSARIQPLIPVSYIFLIAAVWYPEDSLIGLALSYLFLSVGTQQYIAEGPAHSSYAVVVCFGLAGAIFGISAACGVPRLRIALGLPDPRQSQPLLS